MCYFTHLIENSWIKRLKLLADLFLFSTLYSNSAVWMFMEKFTSHRKDYTLAQCVLIHYSVIKVMWWNAGGIDM